MDDDKHDAGRRCCDGWRLVMCVDEAQRIPVEDSASICGTLVPVLLREIEEIQGLWFSMTMIRDV